MKNLICIILSFVLVGGVCLSSWLYANPAGTPSQYEMYCEGVNSWKSDTKANIPPELRSGWPIKHHLKCRGVYVAVTQ